MQVSEDRIDEMARVLAKVVDVHHRTIEGSRLHNPREQMDFWKCPCKTCIAATEILIKNGYNPEDFIEYPGEFKQVK